MLRVEALEERLLLSGITLQNDHLIVEGTDGRDRIVVSETPAEVCVSLSGPVKGRTCFDRDEVRGVSVFAGDGSDVLRGGAGNDTLLGNISPLDVRAVDLLLGQSGFDTAVVSQFGHDRTTSIEHLLIL